MNNPTKTFILKAIADGKKLRIRYFAGSQPGKIREIMPIELKGTLLTAFCYYAEDDRSFYLDKIEVVSDTDNKNLYERPETSNVISLRIDPAVLERIESEAVKSYPLMERIGYSVYKIYKKFVA